MATYCPVLSPCAAVAVSVAVCEARVIEVTAFSTMVASVTQKSSCGAYVIVPSAEV